MNPAAHPETAIRAYRQDDAPEICTLFFATVRSVDLEDYTPEQVRAWAPAPPDPAAWHGRMSARHTLVAEEEDGIVGFAELEEDGHLDMFYGRKDAGRRGVGTRLYDAVEERARSLGIARIFTEASITARPFFERQGFHTLRRNDLTVRGVGMTNYAMEKRLSQPGDHKGQ